MGLRLGAFSEICFYRPSHEVSLGHLSVRLYTIASSPNSFPPQIWALSWAGPASAILGGINQGMVCYLIPDIPPLISFNRSPSAFHSIVTGTTGARPAYPRIQI